MILTSTKGFEMTKTDFENIGVATTIFVVMTLGFRILSRILSSAKN